MWSLKFTLYSDVSKLKRNFGTDLRGTFDAGKLATGIVSVVVVVKSKRARQKWQWLAGLAVDRLITMR